jgi:hypothetical protein
VQENTRSTRQDSGKNDESAHAGVTLQGLGRVHPLRHDKNMRQESGMGSMGW